MGPRAPDGSARWPRWYSRPRYDGASDRGGARHAGRRPARRRPGERATSRRTSSRPPADRPRSGPHLRRPGTGPPTGWPDCSTPTGWARARVVCLLLPSSIDYMVCYAAVARLGGDHLGDQPPPGRARGHLDPRADPAGRDDRRRRTRAAGRAGRHGADPGRVPGRRRRARRPTAWPELHPTDPVAVVWTSGTTGLPKGAVFDHDNLRAVAAGTDVLSEPGDRRLSPLPFAHVGSMTRVWDEAANGVTTVITPTPWRAADAVPVMEAERITVAQGVPDPVGAGARPGRSWRGADLSSLRIAGTGASRVPAELVAAMREALGVPVVVRYTSTEASLGTGTVPGDPDEAVATSVGRPVPGVVADGGRRRRESRARRRGGPGAPAVGRRDARLLGRPADRAGRGRPRLRPGRHRRRAGRRRLAHHRRLRVPRRRRAAAPGGPGQRAVHPGRLQRLPGRGGGGPGRAPRRGPGRRGRRARPGARRGGRGLRGAGGGRATRTRTRCWPACGSGPGPRWPTTRRPTGWWSSTVSP